MPLFVKAIHYAIGKSRIDLCMNILKLGNGALNLRFHPGARLVEHRFGKLWDALQTLICSLFKVVRVLKYHNPFTRRMMTAA